jgi:hypothetical protein
MPAGLPAPRRLASAVLGVAVAATASISAAINQSFIV